MPSKLSKKQQQRKESVESEEYDSEEMSGSDDLGDGQMREVDAANVLNYQTDSDEEDDDLVGRSDDSDDLGANLEK